MAIRQCCERNLAQSTPWYHYTERTPTKLLVDPENASNYQPRDRCLVVIEAAHPKNYGHDKWPSSFVTSNSSIKSSLAFDILPYSIIASSQEDQSATEEKNFRACRQLLEKERSLLCNQRVSITWVPTS